MSEAVVAKRPATYADVLDQPEHVVAEIVGGTLYLGPLPPPRGALAKTALCALLANALRAGRGRDRGWWVMPSPELRLGDDVLVADIAAWRRARTPDLLHRDRFDVAPDWVCEVLQPKTRALDLAVKRPAYARHGVAHLWQVDPDARTLEAFALEGGRWVLVDTLTDAAAVTLPPFDAVAFALADFWA
jgi:Uma2 family endonuclease